MDRGDKANRCSTNKMRQKCLSSKSTTDREASASDENGRSAGKKSVRQDDTKDSVALAHSSSGTSSKKIKMSTDADDQTAMDTHDDLDTLTGIRAALRSNRSAVLLPGLPMSGKLPKENLSVSVPPDSEQRSTKQTKKRPTATKKSQPYSTRSSKHVKTGPVCDHQDSDTTGKAVSRSRSRSNARDDDAADATSVKSHVSDVPQKKKKGASGSASHLPKTHVAHTRARPTRTPDMPQGDDAAATDGVVHQTKSQPLTGSNAETSQNSRKHCSQTSVSSSSSSLAHLESGALNSFATAAREQQTAWSTALAPSSSSQLSFGADHDPTELGQLHALLEARGWPSHLFGALGPRMQRLLQRSMMDSSVTKAIELLQNMQSKDEDQQLTAVIEMSQDGIMLCLTYIDFFSISAQRAALSLAANCCQNVKKEEFCYAQPALPFLTASLQHNDKKCVENACLCFVHLVDSFHSDENQIIEEITKHGLLTNIQQLLITCPAVLTGAMFVSVIHMLVLVCSSCPQLTVTLYKCGKYFSHVDSYLLLHQ